jgi:hypothetical protein
MLSHGRCGNLVHRRDVFHRHVAEDNQFKTSALHRRQRRHLSTDNGNVTRYVHLPCRVYRRRLFIPPPPPEKLPMIASLMSLEGESPNDAE